MSKPREWKFKVGKHNIIVDYDMIPFLSQYTWYVKKSRQTHYAYTNIVIGGKPRSTAMHRLLTGCRKTIVDHINRNGLDNRLENLRQVTAKQNSYNRHRPNKWGYRGVSKSCGASTFNASITLDGKRHSKCGFKTPEDAARAYDEMNKELHGEYGLRNFKD